MKNGFKTILIFILLIALVFAAVGCSPQPPEEDPKEHDDITVEDYILPNNFFLRISVSDGGEELHFRTAKVGDDWETITDLRNGMYEWRFYQWKSENRYFAYLMQNDNWTYQKTVNFYGLMEDSAAALTFLFDTSALPENALPKDKTRIAGVSAYETLEYTYPAAGGAETILELDKAHPNIMLYYSCAGLVRTATNYDRSGGDWSYVHAAGESFYMPPPEISR